MTDCNPRDCPVISRVEALERANEQHSSTHREMFSRLNISGTGNRFAGGDVEEH